MTKIEKFCYRKVDFYKEGYVGMLFLRGGESERFLFPLDLVYKSKKKLISKLKELKKSVDKDKNNSNEVYGALVMKIKFNRTSPLKKEFWTSKPKEETVLDKYSRIKQYLKMFNGGEKFYEIMVMPALYDIKNKKWFFTNWLPVRLNTTDEELAKIAVMSVETQVDFSAKDMALYTIEWIKGVYVETWELVEKEKTDSIKTDYDC